MTIQTESTYTPLSDETREVIHSWQSKLDALGAAVGGWTYKADARQTGASVHFSFEERTDVETTMSFIEVIHTTPQKLNQVCTRLLSADAEVALLRKRSERIALAALTVHGLVDHWAECPAPPDGGCEECRTYYAAITDLDNLTGATS